MSAQPKQAPTYPVVLSGPHPVPYGDSIAVSQISQLDDKGLYLETTVIPNQHIYRHFQIHPGKRTPEVLNIFRDDNNETPDTPRDMPTPPLKFKPRIQRRGEHLRRNLFGIKPMASFEPPPPISSLNVRKRRTQVKTKLYTLHDAQEEDSDTEEPSEYTVAMTAEDVRGKDVVEIQEEPLCLVVAKRRKTSS